MPEPAISLDKLLAPPELISDYAGSFWTRMVKDPDFVSGYLRGIGHLTSQLGVDAQTTQDLADREKVPEHQRLLFSPVVLRASERNTGEALKLRLRSDAPVRLGAQPAGGPYTPGDVYKLGGNVELNDVVAYPLPAHTKTILALVSSPDSTQKILIRGADFVVENQTVMFLGGYDPLLDPAFTAENGQLILVGAEVEQASSHVPEHIGYVLGIWNSKDPGLKAYMNRVWDAYTRGLTRGLLGRALGAILDTPTTQALETVEAVTDSAVVTDRQIYATQGPNHNVGAQLQPGTSIDHAFEVFEREQDLERMKTLLPAVVLDSGFLPPQIEKGIGFGWDEQTWQESEGNFFFDIFGTPEDVEEFWHQATLQGSMVDSARVVPGEFVYRNMLRDHLIVVYIDTNKVAKEALQRLRYLGRLLKARDSQTAIMVILRFDADSDPYEGYSDTDDILDADALNEQAGVGVSTRTLQYRDAVSWRFIPACEVFNADEK